MIHRALLGSIERFTGILIENYAGEFPGWLSPVQVKVLTIGDVSNYLNKITKSLKGFRYEVDDRNLRLGEKLHDASKDKVPITLIVGEKDELSNTLAINIRSQDNQQNVKYEDAIKQIKANLKTPVFKNIMAEGININEEDVQKENVPDDLNSLAVGSYVIPNPLRRRRFAHLVLLSSIIALALNLH